MTGSHEVRGSIPLSSTREGEAVGHFEGGVPPWVTSMTLAPKRAEVTTGNS